jgi:hypothetical protein
MLLSWVITTAVCAWLLFFGGADQIANGWLTALVNRPGMDAVEVKFGAVIAWIAATVGLVIVLA